MAERLIEREYVIAGRVQMVMFRDFAKRKARELGIRGFVRNNEDGTVVVVAQAERDKLDELAKQLKKGPVFAKVESVGIIEKETRQKFKNFLIIY